MLESRKPVPSLVPNYQRNFAASTATFTHLLIDDLRLPHSLIYSDVPLGILSRVRSPLQKTGKRRHAIMAD